MFDRWAGLALERVGSDALGADLRVGRFHLSLIEGRVHITDLLIHNPPGYEGTFLTLGNIVFDLSPMSLLYAWLSSFVRPIVLEVVDVWDLQVSLEFNPAGATNAGEITKSLQRMQRLLHLKSPTTEEQAEVAMHTASARVRSSRVSLKNIRVGAKLVSMPRLSYKVEEVLVKDVGLSDDGVFVGEFVAIVVQAILIACIKAAPENLANNLYGALGPQLVSLLTKENFEGLAFDAGSGLRDMTNIGVWATERAAALQLHMAEAGAAMTGEAIKTGVDLNEKALHMQSELTNAATKATLDADKVGLALAGAGAKAGLMATEASARAGLKATEALTDLNMAFTRGLIR